MKLAKTIGFLVAIYALLPQPTVASDDAVITADVRCVVVGMQIAGSGDASQQSRGIYMTLYYLGRLDGRPQKLDAEALIVAQANSMTSADYAAEAKRCEAGLTEKGRQITDIGKHLSDRATATPGGLPHP